MSGSEEPPSGQNPARQGSTSVRLPRAVSWQSPGNKKNWCWAVGLAALLEYYGLGMELSAVVKRTFPDGDDERASVPQFRANLRQSIVPKEGRPRLDGISIVRGKEVSDEIREVMWSELERGVPVVVATNEVHMRIVTSLSRSTDGRINEATISDDRGSVPVGSEFFVGWSSGAIGRHISGLWVLRFDPLY